MIILSLLPLKAVAGNNDLGVGGVAQNLMEPVGFFSDFVQTGCFIIGASFLFAALIKYFEHRRSPLMVPISTVIFLVIAGVVLVLLPFLSLVVDNGVPYSLMK
ncbi:hypothetical protein [Aquicella lusitana]|nr:hypothetical protein [Aquicella lusitana]